MDILGMFGMLNLLVQVPRVNEYVYSFLPALITKVITEQIQADS